MISKKTIYDKWNNVKKNITLNLIVIDIETSIDKYIIQVAYNIYNSKLELIKSYNQLINENVNKVDFYNKFSLEEIKKYGVSPISMLNELNSDLLLCSHVIGHNISFDISNLKKYFTKYIIPHYFPLKTVCTMLKTRFIYKKNLKLSYLYAYCYGKEMDNHAHEADYDIFITFECFKFLYLNNLITI